MSLDDFPELIVGHAYVVNTFIWTCPCGNSLATDDDVYLIFSHWAERNGEVVAGVFSTVTPKACLVCGLPKGQPMVHTMFKASTDHVNSEFNRLRKRGGYSTN